jgi:hypothetical protein
MNILVHTYSESTSVRLMRNRSSIYDLQSGSKRFPIKKICTFISSIFFALTSFAQLTYEHLAVQYDSPWVCGKLKLIPVRFKGNGNPGDNFLQGGLISFEDAFNSGKVSVKELSLPGGADVSLLELKNYSKKNILIHSGEMVAGGKQDRAFASTMIIPPTEEKNYVGVFCIEKGRWNGKPRAFHYAGSADASLRKEIDVDKKQNKVWKEIDNRLEEEGMQNATWNYLSIYRDSSNIDTSCMHFFRKKMMESDSAYAGFVAITGSRIINCELFGSNDLCVSSFEVMLKSYARSITSNDAEPSMKNDDVKEFLDQFLKTEEQQKQFLKTHGSLYTYQNHVIHLVAYP